MFLSITSPDKNTLFILLLGILFSSFIVSRYILKSAGTEFQICMLYNSTSSIQCSGFLAFVSLGNTKVPPTSKQPKIS